MILTILSNSWTSGTKRRWYFLQQGPCKSKSELYVKISFIKNTRPSTVRMELGAMGLPAWASGSGFCYSACLMAQVKSWIRQTLEEAVFCKLLGVGGTSSVGTDADLGRLRSGVTLGCTGHTSYYRWGQLLLTEISSVVLGERLSLQLSAFTVVTMWSLQLRPPPTPATEAITSRIFLTEKIKK